ncbi:MAG: trypsin-like peptidase domain-containing protein [Bacillota bacterium]|nr:trypsin-like peptidase domain-containing protein [Bacillota bacterium]
MDFIKDFEYDESGDQTNTTKSMDINEPNEQTAETNSMEAPPAETPLTKEEIPDFSTRQEKIKNSKQWNVKGVFSTIAAGVVGSVLTLTILPHTDYIKNLNAGNNQSVQAVQPVQATVANTVSSQPSVGSTSIADTVEKVSKAIVGIVNYQQQQNANFFGNSSGSTQSQNVESGSGSGVIFQKNKNFAYIVTNNHVVEGASKLEVSLYNGAKTTAQIVGSDALTDLAVLKIDAKYVNSTAEFGDSSTLRPGDPVYAIGNPLGLDLSRTVTEGIVSAINRPISVSTSAGDWQTNVIQTDAAINPGNSGGALINSAGQVVGINSLKISETGVEGLGFAIPSDDFIPIVNQLIKDGKIIRPYLGVALGDLDQVPQMYWQNLPANVDKGVIIGNVEPNSTAAKAGIQQYDVIVSLNGTKISNSLDLRKYLYTKVKIGDTVTFGLYRNDKYLSLKVHFAN